jgi:hypothetical protein
MISMFPLPSLTIVFIISPNAGSVNIFRNPASYRRLTLERLISVMAARTVVVAPIRHPTRIKNLVGGGGLCRLARAAEVSAPRRLLAYHDQRDYSKVIERSTRIARIAGLTPLFYVNRSRRAVGLRRLRWLSLAGRIPGNSAEIVNPSAAV